MAILAAFTVSMLDVTRHEHYGVEVPVRKHSGASNLSAVIDCFAIGHRKLRTRGNKIIEIDHRTTFLPQESVDLEGPRAISRRPHHLTTGIDGVSYAAGVITYRPDVGHHTLPPKEGVKLLIVLTGCATGHFSGIIQDSRYPERATQRP